MDDDHHVTEDVGHDRDVATVGAVSGAGVEGGIAVGEGVCDLVDLDELLIRITLVENFPDFFGGYAFRN